MGNTILPHGTMFVTGLLFCGLFFATDSPAAAAKNPCADDIAAYCKDIKPGSGALMECLEQNESSLSPACRDHEAKMGGTRLETRESMRARIRFRKSCEPDIKQFCSNTAPGKDAVATCLSEHKEQISAPCSESMKSIGELNTRQPQTK